MSSFNSLGLSAPILEALEALEYKTATSIQAQSIPLILKGHDLMAEARTGTGKTAAFALPILEKLSLAESSGKGRQVRALVLAPTRELAQQVNDSFKAYNQYLSLRILPVYGGIKADILQHQLKRGTDVIVATPGRLLEMLRRRLIRLDELEYLVLDEADRMLDLGFREEMRTILQYMPKARQTLLFSATFSEDVEAFADAALSSPKRVQVGKRNTANTKVQQLAYAVEQNDKHDILHYLISEAGWGQALVFTRTKRRADAVCEYLKREGIDADAIHGDRSQGERNAALKRFKAGECQILVATDVAARGLDISGLERVVNFDIPNQAQDYIHRIGRTGRAGQTGIAISFVSGEEKRFMKAIAELTGRGIKLQAVPYYEDGREIPQALQSKPSKKSANRKNGKANKPKAQAAPHEKTAPKKPGVRRSLFNK